MFSTALPKASMHTPIGDDNKGARMLAKMGWNKGQGLGKDGSGIINPIKAESYAQSAGIGATTKRDLSSMDDSYKNRTMDVVSDSIWVTVVTKKTCLFVIVNHSFLRLRHARDCLATIRSFKCMQLK